MPRTWILTAEERSIVFLATVLLMVAVLMLALGARSAELAGGQDDDETAPEAAGTDVEVGAAGDGGEDLIERGVAETLDAVEILGEPRGDAPPVSRVREGIILPISGHQSGYYAVLTPCEIEGWVPAEAVRAYLPGSQERAQRLGEATFVLDPGHGGRDPGAVGPTGLTEQQVNDAIVAELLDILRDPERLRAVTEDLILPEGIEPPRVFLTRYSNHTARIGYRATVASVLNADAFLSVHNNAAPEGPLPHPGTETYYQHRSAESKRLGGLIYEELIRALTPYGAGWAGNRDAGAKYRVNSEGDDFYGVLRRSAVPAVLIEGVFISNPPEEELLRQPAVREDIATAIARALARYVLTADPGSGFTEPRANLGSPGGRGLRCEDPL